MERMSEKPDLAFHTYTSLDVSGFETLITEVQNCKLYAGEVGGVASGGCRSLAS